MSAIVLQVIEVKEVIEKVNYFDKKEIIKKNICFAFNVWDINSAKAIIDASLELLHPIFIQVSAKIFDTIDAEEFIYVVKRYINIKKAKVIIHLDHSQNIKQISKAIEFGWDSVMYDGSNLSLNENINNTNIIVDISKKMNVLVEAEIGQVKGVEDDICVEKNSEVLIEDVQKFISSTNVDLLAVAIGTAHGQYGNILPKINYDLLKQIGEISDIPFVVHGGSELTDDILKKLISHNNVKKINISTDIKQAYRNGIIESTKLGLLNEKNFDALKVQKQIYDNIKSVAISKLRILKEI